MSKEGGAEEEEEGKDKADTHSHLESTPLQEYLSFFASLFLLGFLGFSQGGSGLIVSGSTKFDESGSPN